MNITKYLRPDRNLQPGKISFFFKYNYNIIWGLGTGGVWVVEPPSLEWGIFIVIKILKKFYLFGPLWIKIVPWPLNIMNAKRTPYGEIFFALFPLFSKCYEKPMNFMIKIRACRNFTSLFRVLIFHIEWVLRS